MARVAMSGLADADTAQIILDLGGTAGASVADRYDAAFDRVYRRLERFPNVGAPRTKLGKDARICVVRPYIIVYDYSKRADLVTILRILHGRRKLTRGLLRRP